MASEVESGDLDSFSAIIKECLKYDDKLPTVTQIKAKKKDIDGILKNKESEYADFKEKFDFKMKVYNDPLHGSIQLNPLEDAIVNTPEFYRLREIKQLGGKSHVFPGAVHTRFEHSIGVCYLAGKLIKHLKERSHLESLTNQEELCVRLAGLCHDLGHGPFSHLFEGVMKKIAGKEFTVLKHEKISVMVFKRILLKHHEILIMFEKCGLTGAHVEMIGDMINSEGVMEKVAKKKKYLYEIVANSTSGMDVDKWDYFARDCHYLGLKNEFDMERCIALSSIVENDGECHVGFREKEKRNIYGMFRTRCVLFQKAYNHKTADGIDMMIKDALYQAREIPLWLPQLDGNDCDTQKQESMLPGATALNGDTQKQEDMSPGAKALNGDTQKQENMSPGATSLKGDTQKQEDMSPGATTLKQIIYRAMKKNDLSGYIQLTDSILRTLMLIPSSETELKKVQLHIRRIAMRDIYKPLCEHSYFSDEYNSPLKQEGLKNGGPFLTYPLNDFEIENLAIKYASEKTEDPADKIYFFEKKESECAIPKAHVGTSGDTPGEERGIKPESKLNLPRAFVEYRISLYSKDFKQLSKEKKSDVETKFGEFVSAIMAKLKKSSCSCPSAIATISEEIETKQL